MDTQMFEREVDSIMARGGSAAVANSRRIEAALASCYDPAERANLEEAARAHDVALARLMHTAALDKTSEEKRRFMAAMGWSDASYTRQPQPRP